jgi:RecT family
LAAFLLVAKQYDLNPFIKEIYAFPSKRGGIVPVVSVDGWCSLINRQPHFDGAEFEDTVVDGKLFSVTCRIFRKDRSHSMAVTEYMSECKRSIDTWDKWPSRMLRHKSLIQCGRYAFGLSGIYDPDEVERIQEAEGSSVVTYETPSERNQLITGKLKDFVAKAIAPEVEQSPPPGGVADEFDSKPSENPDADPPPPEPRKSQEGAIPLTDNALQEAVEKLQNRQIQKSQVIEIQRIRKASTIPDDMYYEILGRHGAKHAPELTRSAYKAVIDAITAFAAALGA